MKICVIATVLMGCSQRDMSGFTSVDQCGLEINSLSQKKTSSTSEAIDRVTELWKRLMKTEKNIASQCAVLTAKGSWRVSMVLEGLNGVELEDVVDVLLDSPQAEDVLAILENMKGKPGWSPRLDPHVYPAPPPPRFNSLRVPWCA